ncbi:DUF2243 domain-containing protein [Dietzia sp. DQ11-71]|nr:DUF2243 domain-containing protein [Dietzia sp. DQ11-71]MBB1018463.1 DUF2243 domain-containing protein [Dietzia sp. DQ11-71]
MPTSSTPESAAGPRPDPTTDPTAGRRLVHSGFLFGCGIAGSVIDLFVFHLVLQWHHFYDLSTTTTALVADGLFHGATWLITVWGLFMFADVRQQIAVPWARWVGAVLTGVGFFQLVDGIVFHKLLGIHQIRYGVDLLVYDLVWILSAILLLVIGLVLLRRTRNTALPAPTIRRPRG